MSTMDIKLSRSSSSSHYDLSREPSKYDMRAVRAASSRKLLTSLSMTSSGSTEEEGEAVPADPFILVRNGKIVIMTRTLGNRRRS